MARFLSEEWLAMVVRRGAELPEVPGCSVTVDHVVSSSPEGRLRRTVQVRDGRIVAAAPGKDGDADCTMTWTYDDAAAALAAELDVDVAFMQGRVKVEGNYAPVLVGLREVLGGDAGRQFVEAVRAETEV